MFFINPHKFDYDPIRIKTEIYKQIVSYDTERMDNIESLKEEYVQKINDETEKIETIIEGLWGMTTDDLISHPQAHYGQTVEQLTNARHSGSTLRKNTASSFRSKYHMMVVLTDFMYLYQEDLAEWQADPDRKDPFIADITPINDEDMIAKGGKYIGFGVKYNKETKQHDIYLTPTARIIMRKDKDRGFYLDTIFLPIDGPDTTRFTPNQEITSEETVENQISEQLNLTYLEDKELYEEYDYVP